MSVEDKDVAYVANLARLQLTKEEVSRFKEDMNRILEHMETLNEIDTSDVKPLEHVTETYVRLRPDKAQPPLPHDEALKNAPDADSDYFRVPRVIE
jgi:aspartyl-tRNA(Asn)/glutamyl-tRNA(Gln) amidotransferase subunit C